MAAFLERLSSVKRERTLLSDAIRVSNSSKERWGLARS